ncbi:MAG TPA: hypothetical protein VGB28_07385 [Actinomycetota bacterium]
MVRAQPGNRQPWSRSCRARINAYGLEPVAVPEGPAWVAHGFTVLPHAPVVIRPIPEEEEDTAP